MVVSVRRQGRRATAVRVAAACGAALLAVAGYGGYRYLQAAFSDGPTSVPVCSWPPLHVHGQATQEQSGLVRCYIRALATRDRGGLQAVADPSAEITGRDLAHAADARAGEATATFLPDATDGAYLTVNVVFADRARASVAMALANPASAHSWRCRSDRFLLPRGRLRRRRQPNRFRR